MRRGSIAATDPAGPDNPVFLSLNRNKRSVALDFRDEAGLASVRACSPAPTSSSATSAPG